MENSEKNKRFIFDNFINLGRIFNQHGIETKTPDDPFFNDILDLICKNAKINPIGITWSDCLKIKS